MWIPQEQVRSRAYGTPRTNLAHAWAAPYHRRTPGTPSGSSDAQICQLGTRRTFCCATRSAPRGTAASVCSPWRPARCTATSWGIWRTIFRAASAGSALGGSGCTVAPLPRLETCLERTDCRTVGPAPALLPRSTGRSCAMHWRVARCPPRNRGISLALAASGTCPPRTPRTRSCR